MASTSVLGGVVQRREDPALIQGKGRFVDDIQIPGMLHAAFARSPFAHARITSIDTSAALAMPGVRAVYTSEDVKHLGVLPAQAAAIGRPLLADREANHMGEAVAMIIAETRDQAQDALELVEVDYEPLPAVLDLKDALNDANLVHENTPCKLITWTAPFGMDEAGLDELRVEIDEIKARDDTITVSTEMVNQRLIPVAIEPRSVIGDWSSGYREMTVYSSSQAISTVAAAVAKVLGIPYNMVRGIAPEVGGGFGSKLPLYMDELLVPWASQQLDAPVKFTETRREAASSTIHGRGWLGTASITGTKDGEMLVYELDAICDLGAYCQSLTLAIPFLGVLVGSGQYKFKTRLQLDCVLTNKQTTDAYRGAGRPEAIYYVERAVDAFAREIGMDLAELKLKNFIPEEDFPGATSPVGFEMDTGAYAMNLQTLLDHPDYAAMKARRDELIADGKLAGVGLSTYVEACGFGPSALVDLGFSWSGYGLPTAFNGSGLVRVNPDGTATVTIGTGPSGQGHQTTWAQIVSNELGIELDNIKVNHGDTRDATVTIGTFGSRSAAVDGTATYEAAHKVRDKAARIAASLLEASEADIQFADGGAFVAGSPDQRVDWAAIAEVAYQPHRMPDGEEGGLEAHSIFSPANATWPFGTMACLVVVDPETGDVNIEDWLTMDDCGNVINPMIVDGQIHGGIVQGVGQALFEEAVYDDDGNLLTAGLIDYPLVTAADVPFFKLNRTVTPTDINPLGVKGIGEAGTIGAAQTLVNGVIDALHPLGVKHIDMPMRPRKVWQAIQDAKA